MLGARTNMETKTWDQDERVSRHPSFLGHSPSDVFGQRAAIRPRLAEDNHMRGLLCLLHIR